MEQPENIDILLKEIISDVLEMSIMEIDNSASVRSLCNWKGIKHRLIIERIEKEFDIQFSIDERDTLISYKIIRATIIAHKR